MSIVNFISSWLKDIVVLFILISITELVMPKGNMKRYIDLVIGLLIIFTIITPFAKIIKKDFSLDKTVFNYFDSMNSTEEDEEKFYIEQEKQIEKLYKEKIENEIKNLINEESTYILEDLYVDILNDDESYGDIQYLEITLAEAKEDIKDNKISIEKIKPIEIKKKKEDLSKNHEGEHEGLKELISTKYSIEKDKITIINYEKRNGE